VCEVRLEIEEEEVSGDVLGARGERWLEVSREVAKSEEVRR